MKLLSVAGARPNFMKISSIEHAITKSNVEYRNEKIEHIIVHTGQHYDQKMSENFFEDLGIPRPDINLNVGSGSHAIQTAEIMKRFEPILLKEMPDVLLVVGDVNSTIACALVAAKVQYPIEHAFSRPIIVHVEAGLRSFDRDMPEEVNRILTDALSDLLFVTEKDALANLKREGVNSQKIHFVGNVMIDTLQQHLEKSSKSTVKNDLGISSSFGLVTLHRPSNVDKKEVLLPIVKTLLEISKKILLVFPVHPRTMNKLRQYMLLDEFEHENNIILTDPLGYLDFLSLINDSSFVITDSGGIQEETTFLRVPCVTLRENTERPVTVSVGSNYLIGTDPSKICSTVEIILADGGKMAEIPELWDGRAGDRIIDVIAKEVQNSRVLSLEK